MKKKWIAILAFAVLILAIVLSLALCGKEEAPTGPVAEVPTETTESPATTATEAPAPTEPEWELGYSRASYAEALFATLEKGAAVDVLGQFLDYYVIAGEQHNLIVEKRFVRLDSEEAFEHWNGYACPNTNVFESVYIREEPIAQLATNTEVKVLEGKGNWLYIEWEGGNGYVKSYTISEDPISTGGSSGGSSSPTPAPAPIDGTDVDVNLLSSCEGSARLVKLGNYHGPKMDEDFEKGTGVVLADDVEAYLTIYHYGDEIKVLEHDEESCVVYLGDGATATLPRYLVKLDGDEEEETWTGYAASGAPVYEEYQRRNVWGSLEMNVEVEVLYELPGIEYGDENIYVVSIDGEILYMNISSVSDEKFVPAAPSGGSGGSSGGGGSTESVWTPPML